MEDQDRADQEEPTTGRYRLPPPGGWGSIGESVARGGESAGRGADAGTDPGPGAAGPGGRRPDAGPGAGGPGGPSPVQPGTYGSPEAPPGLSPRGWSTFPGGWGSPPGGGPGGGAAYYGGSSGPPRSKHSTRSKVLVGLGVLVAAAGLGSGLTLAVGGTNGSGSVQAYSPPPVNGVSTGVLNVSAIAEAVDPGVVDITSMLGYQDAESAGTGMVLTSNGEVVTNNHVVDGATSINVNVAGSSRTYKAKVLGTDPTQDIALIQMEGASGLKTVRVGNSSSVKLGAAVVAIGNALDLPGPPTVTSGTITAEGRSVTAGDESTGNSENLTGLFQTNAELQPGNSGGPLVASNGRIIGMDTAAATDSSEETTNVGFAIPINTVESVVRQIQSGSGTSKVQIGNPSRGYLGVGVENVSAAESNPTGNSGLGGFGGFGLGGLGGFDEYTPPVSSGALVVEVEPGSPGLAAGLQEGDVIVSVNGTTVSNISQLTKLLASTRPGSAVQVDWVDASGRTQSASITLGIGPAD